MTGYRRVLGSSGRVLAVAAALIASIAAGVSFTGYEAQVRSQLGLSFVGLPSSADEARAIALHNVALCACPLLGASVACGHRTRATITVVLSGLLIANCGALGLAAGAYGVRVIRPHVVLELLAFCIAGGAYAAAGSTRLERSTVVSVAAGSIALIAVSAALEVRPP